MTHPKIIILLLLFFTSSFFYCKAQERNKYVYQDSSVKAADTTPVKVTGSSAADSVQVTDSAKTMINIATVADTVLRLNSLVLSADSVKALKNLSSFTYEKNLDSLLKDLQKKRAAEEVQLAASENRSTWLDEFFDSVATKIFLWSLAVLFILFVLYKLFFAEGIFQKREIKSNVKELNDDEVDGGIDDYDKLIAQSERDNNYRLAVRYLYLQSLQKLAANNLVHLVADKTNYQYINELNGTIYKKEFSWLTLNYEYVWYGEFDLNKEAFTQLQNNFRQFNNRLHKI